MLRAMHFQARSRITLISCVLHVGGAQGIAAVFNEKEVVHLNDSADLVEINRVAQGMGDEDGAGLGCNRRGDLVS
jgi:hypothetical protein